MRAALAQTSLAQIVSNFHPSLAIKREFREKLIAFSRIDPGSAMQFAISNGCPFQCTDIAFEFIPKVAASTGLPLDDLLKFVETSYDRDLVTKAYLNHQEAIR